MNAPRYGIKYPDGSYTGGITADHSLAAHYARLHKAVVYKVGSSDDPEVSCAHQQ